LSSGLYLIEIFELFLVKDNNDLTTLQNGGISMNVKVFELLQKSIETDVVLRHYVNTFKGACKECNLPINRDMLGNAEAMPSSVKITFDNLKDYVNRVYFKMIPDFNTRITKRMHTEAYHESIKRDPSLLQQETKFTGERDGNYYYECRGCESAIMIRKQRASTAM
jgi:hypothetical protein